jgi:hypothetical protein
LEISVSTFVFNFEASLSDAVFCSVTPTSLAFSGTYLAKALQKSVSDRGWSTPMTGLEPPAAELDAALPAGPDDAALLPGALLAALLPGALLAALPAADDALATGAALLADDALVAAELLLDVSLLLEHAVSDAARTADAAITGSTCRIFMCWSPCFDDAPRWTPGLRIEQLS